MDSSKFSIQKELTMNLIRYFNPKSFEEESNKISRVVEINPVEIESESGEKNVGERAEPTR